MWILKDLAEANNPVQQISKHKQGNPNIFSKSLDSNNNDRH